jgi:hypothetical protein
MHEIEPHFLWRDDYRASDDGNTPFYNIEHNELYYTNQVYNYVIHPQWDEFGSETLFLKILFADYGRGFAIIELIGEWNDALHNDVMLLKREVIDLLIDAGIDKYILIGEHVYNFHFSDDSYYEEWISDTPDGWIYCLNFHPHVVREWEDNQLTPFFHMDDEVDLPWRKMKPLALFEWVEKQITPTAYLDSPKMR